MISVIIPSLPDSDELNKKCVESLKSTTKVELKFLVKTSPGSFAKNINDAVPLANGAIFLITNNDTIYLEGWAESLQVRSQRENAGILSLTPRTDCGWAFGIRADVFRDVGLLDETLVNSYDDYDYFYRCALKGYKRIVAEKTYAIHHGSQSLKRKYSNEDWNEQTKRNREYMQRKWPGVDIDEIPKPSFDKKFGERVRA